MADDERKESESSEPKKKSSTILLVILILLIFIAGGGVAAYFLLIKKEPQTAGPAGDMSPGQNTPLPMSTEPGPMLSYPAFIVNLADPGGQRYLKVTLSLELSKDKNFPTEVATKEPKIKDIIITILSSKTYDEISTTQGKVALKQEILRRLNTVVSTGRITEVYITEFMIQ